MSEPPSDPRIEPSKTAREDWIDWKSGPLNADSFQGSLSNLSQESREGGLGASSPKHRDGTPEQAFLESFSQLVPRPRARSEKDTKGWRRALWDLDAWSLAKTAAALQLVPENADRTMVLEGLAHAAILPKIRGRKGPVTRDTLLKAIRAVENRHEEIRLLQDPCENPFTEAVTFYGGSYIVFPGIGENITFVARHMALAACNSPRVADGFRAIITPLFHAVLAVSNEVARKAGLHRNTVHKESVDGLVVPDLQGLANLKLALTFTDSELQTLLGRWRISPTVLAPFVHDATVSSNRQYEAGNPPFARTPMLRNGDELVICLPGSLLYALVLYTLYTAESQGVLKALQAEYQQAVWRTVLNSCKFAGFHPDSVPLDPPHEFAGLSDALFRADTDKLVHVTLATDLGLSDNSKSIQKAVESRIREVEERLIQRNDSLNDVLHVVLSQSAGFPTHLGLSRTCRFSSMSPLLLSASDFEVLALLEKGQDLAIWKFAKDLNVFSPRTSATTDALNAYYYYRQHRHSFYLSDDRPPDLVHFTLGGAGVLRSEIAAQRDRHGTPSYRPGQVGEVTRCYGGDRVPIFVPYTLTPERYAFLVELHAHFIWVLTSRAFGDSNSEAVYCEKEYAETIAYWLWQLAPVLQRIFAAQRAMIALCIWVEWQTSDDEPFFACRVNSDSSAVHVTIASGASKVFMSKDNAGEKRLISEILKAIRQHFSEECSFTDAELAEAVHIAFRKPEKKKLHVFDTSEQPTLDPRGLARPRIAADRDEEVALDSLAEHLTAGLGLKPNECVPGGPSETFNACVGFLFQELRRQTKTLAPVGLLEFLVAQHESHTYNRHLARLHLPTTVGCFENQEEVLGQMLQDTPKYATTTAAQRFLIELMVAEPPSGLRPISNELFDALIGICAEIVNLGSESDFVKNGLVDLRPAVLPSGRLGVDREALNSAQRIFGEDFAAGELHRTRAASGYASTPMRHSQLDAQMLHQIQAATKEQFGLSLQDIQVFIGAAVAIGFELNPGVATLERIQFEKTVGERCEWSVEKVRSAIDLLSLRPRLAYLDPPTGFRKPDIWPWLMSRRLSYIRRPLLIRQPGPSSQELVWGPRHTYQAGVFLADTLLEGRLPIADQSHRLMSKLMGQINNANGRLFNDHVAELLRQNPSLIVRSRVEKIRTSSQKLRLPGDIDILVVDTRRAHLIVGECKDLSVARTPVEMKHEIENLAGPVKSASAQLAKRVEWVTNDLGSILDWLEVDSQRSWTVKPVIVVDHELMSQHLQGVPYPVVPLHRLAERAAQGLELCQSGASGHG